MGVQTSPGRVIVLRRLLWTGLLVAASPLAAFARQVSTPGSSEVSRPVELTPLVTQIAHPPIPVKGGDGRFHLVYELELANFTGDHVTAGPLVVLNADTGASVARFSAAQVGERLVVRDSQAQPGQFTASQYGILYLHLICDTLESVPRILEHQLTMTVKNATVSPTAGRVRVAPVTQLLLDAPLRGHRYIAGDGCCDSTRHVRATLGLDGRAFDAQRFAIDWEQLDERDRIYVGDAKDPNSYLIYGKPAYAVADARVIAAVDGLQDSPIGSLPNLPLDQADGNHVILDLGGGQYALYAHFKPHSVQVHEGQYVKRRQLLGRVGTSGNSSEPHLHFQVTDGPSALLSNGLPYLVRQFSATRRGASTAAFEKAIAEGQPIETVALPGPAAHNKELPLDLWITDLP